VLVSNFTLCSLAAVRAYRRIDFLMTWKQDTDTLYIEFRSGEIVDTKDLDENTQLDVDAEGRIRERADLQHFSFEQVGT
jgi:hypothetical protein